MTASRARWIAVWVLIALWLLALALDFGGNWAHILIALGIAILAGFGALVASMSDVGIDEKVIKELRDKITRGTSGVFMLTASAVPDQVLDEMKAQPGHVELIESNLTRDQESKLRKIFAAYSQPKPAVSPMPNPVWPLYFAALSFVVTRRAGGLFVLGMIAGAILGW